MGHGRREEEEEEETNNLQAKMQKLQKKEERKRGTLRRTRDTKRPQRRPCLASPCRTPVAVVHLDISTPLPQVDVFLNLTSRVPSSHSLHCMMHACIYYAAETRDPGPIAVCGVGACAGMQTARRDLSEFCLSLWLSPSLAPASAEPQAERVRVSWRPHLAITSTAPYLSHHMINSHPTD